MKPGIQWKLMFSYILLILLMGTTLFFYLQRTLSQSLLSEIRQNLTNSASLAAAMATREITDLRHDGPEAAGAIGKAIKARVTIIADDGTVAGDSEIVSSELKDMEGHGNRPEVQQALQSGTGSAIRHSATLRTSMLYVAKDFTARNGDTGVIRLALPLASLEKAKAGLHKTLTLAITLALLAALLLSYILSRVTSHSLREMAAIANQIGKGNFGRQIPVKSDDELGKLAQVMNLMSTRIAQQMEQLSSEKNRLNAILCSMGEGLIVSDISGTITMANPAFVSFFSINEPVQGKKLLEIARHPGLQDTFSRVLATGEETVDEISINNGGRTILTHWVPLLESETLYGIVAVFHDITEIKKADKIRKDFVANVSHELRTPVTVIKGYAETLLAGGTEKSPEQSLQFIEIIHKHSERLATLINELLILSELESGKVRFNLAPLSVATSIAQAVKLLEGHAEEKEITLTMEEMDQVPAVLADRVRLEQVLINLIDNAIKYTPKEGSVRVSACEAEGMVKIEVRDTGIGIPEKDLPRLFERFYRVDAARSRAEGGTGLGLSIVKHIIQIHGGSVSVESTPGKGSLFSFTLKKAAP